MILEHWFINHINLLQRESTKGPGGGGGGGGQRQVGRQFEQGVVYMR